MRTTINIEDGSYALTYKGFEATVLVLLSP
jgi:hypothetical protein